MIKVRLLKSRAGDFMQLLDSAEIPSLDSLEDLVIIIRTVGNLLKPYQEAMKDPNIVTALNDQNVKDWTVADLESIKYELNRQGFTLIVTEETGEDLNMTAGQVKYLIEDSSNKVLGIIPYGDTRVYDLKDAVDSLAILNALASVFENSSYFNSKKFNNNPIKELLNQLTETRKVLGTLNVSAMNKLHLALNKLDKKVYAFSLA